MSTTRPVRIGALALGTAVMATSLVTAGSAAFADDDDEIDGHDTCATIASTHEDTADDYDNDREDQGDDDSDQCATPVADSSSNPSADATANALLSVQRETRKRLVVEAGVENADAGQSWRLEVWQNGRQRLTMTEVTDTTGAVQVTRALKDRRGTDRIRLVATSSSGERVDAKVKGFRAAPRPPQNSNNHPNGSGTSKPS